MLISVNVDLFRAAFRSILYVGETPDEVAQANSINPHIEETTDRLTVNELMDMLGPGFIAQGIPVESTDTIN